MSVILSIPLTTAVSISELRALLEKLESVHEISCLLRSTESRVDPLTVSALEIGTPNFLELIGNQTHLAMVTSFVAIVLSATTTLKTTAEAALMRANKIKAEAEARLIDANATLSSAQAELAKAKAQGELELVEANKTLAVANARKVDVETKLVELNLTNARAEAQRRNVESGAAAERVTSTWIDEHVRKELIERRRDGHLSEPAFERCVKLIDQLPHDVALAGQILATDRDLLFRAETRDPKQRAWRAKQRARGELVRESGVTGRVVLAAELRLRELGKVERLGDLINYLAWLLIPDEHKTTGERLAYHFTELRDELGNEGLNVLVDYLRKVMSSEEPPP